MKLKIKKRIVRTQALIALLCLFAPQPAFAQVMSSSNYRIASDSVNSGGVRSTSGSYGIEDTAGETATGRSSSGTYALSAGYQQAGSSTPDTQAPSVPNGLTATVVSTSRIDLAWNPSSDNRGVSGYKVFRNSAQVATSTSVSYSDTGLAAGTSYSYTISAFDATGNTSAHSATATATTLSESAPSQAGGGGTIQLLPPSIYGVNAEAGSSYLRLNWLTNRETSGIVRWGSTANYEMGSRSSSELVVSHTMNIEGLEAGRTYVLSIEAVDQYGMRSILEGVRFTTMPASIAEAPINVTGFKAIAGENSISLGWTNPSSKEFDAVRIVRSAKFFPSSPDEGEVIYEGRGTSFEDANVEKETLYYYAAFARDSRGAYSSGALASAMITESGIEVPNPLDNLPPSKEVHPKIKELKLEDFIFIQDGKQIPVINDTVAINGELGIKIMLDYDKVPEVLKTIAFTMTHPDDKEKRFTFLLRINETKTAYEAALAPLGDGGRYGLGISIVDHENRGMKRINGGMVASVEGAFVGGAQQANLILKTLLQIIKIFALIAILIAILLVAYYASRKRDKDRQERK